MAIKTGVDKMNLPEPYFMKNKEWFYFDENQFRYVLTSKAPPKAIESYNEFYNQVDGQNREEK